MCIVFQVAITHLDLELYKELTGKRGLRPDKINKSVLLNSLPVAFQAHIFISSL